MADEDWLTNANKHNDQQQPTTTVPRQVFPHPMLLNQWWDSRPPWIRQQLARLSEDGVANWVKNA